MPNLRRKSPPVPDGIHSRLTDCLQRAAEVGSQAGLYQLDHTVDDLFATQIRAFAWELHGVPAESPELLEQRESLLRHRADQATGRAKEFLNELGRAILSRPAPHPIFGWRGSTIIVLAAAVCALCMPSLTWRAGAIVTLSACFCALLFPMLPTAFIASVRGIAAGGRFARDLFEAALARHRCSEIERARWAAADHAMRVDRWVTAQMARVLAEYGYHKALAVAARLPE